MELWFGLQSKDPNLMYFLCKLGKALAFFVSQLPFELLLNIYCDKDLLDRWKDTVSFCLTTNLIQR